MKKLLLITIILLLQSFPSYSNTILNKGFLCEKIDVKVNGLNLFDDDDVVGLGFFKKDKIDIWLVDNLDINKNRILTELILRDDLLDSSYRLWEGQLKIFLKSLYSSDTSYISINRYNLLMTKDKKKYQCELFFNKSIFRKKILNYGKELLKQRKF
jgi:hypothetical protein